MKTNNNISKRVYKLVGFENSQFIKTTFTIGELLSNDANDTELLYTLQENHIDDIIDLEVGHTLYVESSRDAKFGCGCVICRIS